MFGDFGGVLGFWGVWRFVGVLCFGVFWGFEFLGCLGVLGILGVFWDFRVVWGVLGCFGVTVKRLRV